MLSAPESKQACLGSPGSCTACCRRLSQVVGAARRCRWRNRSLACARDSARPLVRRRSKGPVVAAARAPGRRRSAQSTDLALELCGCLLKRLLRSSPRQNTDLTRRGGPGLIQRRVASAASPRATVKRPKCLFRTERRAAKGRRRGG
eukprot:357859-Chlamydomonas_euryale.AAC.20